MKKKLLSVLIISVVFVVSGSLVFSQVFSTQDSNLGDSFFTYYQSSGILEVEAVFDNFAKMKYFYAFSGKGDCMNEPDCEGIRNKGPVPRGNYTLDIRPDGYTRPDGTHFGGPVILLIPDKDTADKIKGYGRGVYDFIIHGGTKSDGCIIINKKEIFGNYELYNRYDLYRIIQFYGINKLEVLSGDF